MTLNMEKSSTKLRNLAESSRQEVLKRLPKGRMNRFILFVEVVRVIDYWGILSRPNKENKSSLHKLDLMYWGWNMAVASLFESLEQPNSFPLMESTEKSRNFAVWILSEFGKVSLLKRLADMEIHGIAEVIWDDRTIHISMVDSARSQFNDFLEIDRLEKAEAMLHKYDQNFDDDKPYSIESFAKIFKGISEDNSTINWEIKDLNHHIRPLVKPWITGNGVMVGYDSTVEVDKHFAAEALKYINRWRHDAGLHPTAQLGQFTGNEVTSIVTALVSFYLKHVECVLIASHQFQNISIQQSLTIWTPRQELEKSVSEFTGIEKSIVHSIFDIIATTPEKAKIFENQSNPLIPLFFDLGNGLLLRPVSSLTRNPITTATNQFKIFDQKIENSLAEHRENWMRSDLYYLFKGSRYKCLEGNIKLRKEGKIATDIDAVVYDSLTGDLGIFQLKWQDYQTNNVRQLHSKAKNLATELTSWSEKVNNWIQTNGIEKLSKTLRLKTTRPLQTNSIYLFALSKSIIRTEGYGVPSAIPNLAMATWSQFVRKRIEIGPSSKTLQMLHQHIIYEYARNTPITPIPTTILIGDFSLQIFNLWNQVD